MISRAIALNGNAPADHYNLANALIHQWQSEQAIRHYRQAIRFKPDYYAAYASLGQALRHGR
jgi:tetratricopeptide (TPR) repeat protein